MPTDKDPIAAWQSQTVEGFRMTPKEITMKSEALEAKLRNRTRGGYLVCAFLIVMFSIWFAAEPDVLMRTGAALSFLAVVNLGVQVHRYRFRPLPGAELGAVPSAEHLRNELARQRDFHRGRGFWLRLLFLAVAGAVFFVGFARAHPEVERTVQLELLALVLLTLAAIPVNVWLARKYQRQIDQLDRQRGAAHAVIALLMLAFVVPTLVAQTPADADIRKILVQRIDEQRQGVGIVVGVIDASGRRTIAHGRLAKGDERNIGADTVFEIGSVTKVFTSLLLADMVARGEVALDDPLSKHLPETVKPRRPDITLEQLATHTSGLPRLPLNHKPEDLKNPYADFTVAGLYECLASCEMRGDNGYEYSNLGAGLLGHILARRAGMDYETLVRRRILEPLKMKDTSITLTPAMRKRLATGHDATLSATPLWDLPALAGAGALRSTANDMLKFLAAILGYEELPLTKTAASMLKARRTTGKPGLDIALAWHVTKVNGRDMVWHNGGTGGFRSFLGYDPERRVGVVVLSNASMGPAGVDDIGVHVLDKSSKLVEPPKQRMKMKLDAAVLDRYTGRYQLAPQFILNVTREGDRLFVQATGQPNLEVFASGEREFFYEAVDAQLTFELGDAGKATRVVLHQNGRSIPAARME